MIRESIASIVQGHSLSFQEAAQVMEEIMDGEATSAQFAAFTTALRIKGETIDEITGLASVMREKAIPVHVTPPVLDTCGTGGDGLSSFNISTTAAFVVAGAGIKVAKHGNRAMSSGCGSADTLEALGLKIDLGAEEVSQCIEEVGIGFMFAPLYHPSMKHAAAPRREIGIRTIFNVLGPLSNPARAEYQLIGVPSREIGYKLAHALYRLGTKHSLVVHGIDGMDEITISGKSFIWDIDEQRVSSPYEICPDDFGINTASINDIKGGTPPENADRLRSILKGQKGPRRNIVILNAAAALVASNKAPDFMAGIHMAKEAIDSGRALDRLEALIKLSQNLAPSIDKE
jgi:anthranilate phosphoribosyltransferase